MNTITPKKGKEYTLRNGMRYRCYATEAGGEYTVHGAYLESGIWRICNHTSEGRFSPQLNDTAFDIISEWIDKPVVDWPKMPAWSVAVSSDEGGPWYWYDARPSEQADYWKNEGAMSGIIPDKFAPTFTGSWRDSLVERPKE